MRFIFTVRSHRETYWDLLKDNTRVRYVYRDHLGTVYGQDIGKDMLLWSDSLRGDILFKYGGIYADADVIVSKPLNKTMRCYDAIVSLD